MEQLLLFSQQLCELVPESHALVSRYALPLQRGIDKMTRQLADVTLNTN